MMKRQRPTGIAVVELAVCLPVLLTIVFATIEVCTMIHLRQRIKVSAYEGARVGITPNSTASNVIYHCETLLDSQSVHGYTLSMTPTDPSTLASGDYFQMTVSADFAPNSLIGGWIYDNQRLSESVTLAVD